MKTNTPADIRKKAAEHLRECRAMFPTLKGDWTRKEWNARCRASAHNLITNLVRFRKANEWKGQA